MKRSVVLLAISLVVAIAIGAGAGFIWHTYRNNSGGSSSGEMGPETDDMMTLNLYFIRSEEGQSYLEMLQREVQSSELPPRQAIIELIRGPQGEGGLKPVLPPSVQVLDIRIEGGVCVLDLSKEAITCANQIGPSATTEEIVLGAIANTLTEFEDIQQVRLLIEGAQSGLIDGQQIESFWGHIKLPALLSRDASIIGRRPIQPPKWSSIDRINLAEAWGWQEIIRGNQSSPRLAFTFDGGASNSAAASILDTLADMRVSSTFFLTGEFIEKYPDTVSRILKEGHEAGNHTYNHPDFVRTNESLSDQIARTETAFAGFSGLSLKPYFRFPYGSRNAALLNELNALGYLSVFWTVDSLGWQNGMSAESVYNRVMNGAGPGVIVLMHLDPLADAQALPGLIRDLRSRGYEIVSLTELLSPGP